MKEKTTYMLVKVEKPLTNNSKVSGKFLTIKEWVKTKTREEKNAAYTHPVFLSQVFEEEGFVKIYCRNSQEFRETLNNYLQKIGEN